MSYLDVGEIKKQMEEVRPEIERILGRKVDFATHFDGDEDSLSVSIRGRTGGQYAYFSLAGMPGCCGVCVSTGAYVVANHRGKGLGTLLNRVRQKIAAAALYGVLLCTDVDDNEAEIAVLAKTGWATIHTFTNPRSGNTVNISVVNLQR